MRISAAAVAAQAEAMQAAFEDVARRNEWEWIAERFYAADCTYLCEYGGTMRVQANSRDEIRATHYGRDMKVGWGSRRTRRRGGGLGHGPSHRHSGKNRARRRAYRCDQLEWIAAVAGDHRHCLTISQRARP